MNRVLFSRIAKPFQSGKLAKSTSLWTLTRREFSAEAPAMDKYSLGMQYMHWLMGAGMMVCVGTVKLSQWTPKDEPKKYGMTKGELMTIHKSTALIVAGLFVPRVLLRLTQKHPPLPEGNFLEHLGANLSHGFLYFAMFFMPFSGIAMGLAGGKGLPFFNLFTIDGWKEPNKEIASQAFKNHKLVGQALTYMIPLHVGAVGFHAIKGQNILTRMLP